LQTLLFCEAQLFPQPPQFVSFSKTSASQPSSAPLAGRLQLPRPGAQKEVQAFPVHARLATEVVEHLRSQPPQFAISSRTSRSHPGAALVLSQSP
jgi:hypothetical protein